MSKRASFLFNFFPRRKKSQFLTCGEDAVEPRVGEHRDESEPVVFERVEVGEMKRKEK